MIKLFGQEEVFQNIVKAAEKMGVDGETALVETGQRIREKGMRLTPVGDTGNLIGSWYGPVVLHKDPVLVEIGLTAEYAPYVHEMVDANFRKPGATAKFLENPLKEESNEYLSELQKKMKV